MTAHLALVRGGPEHALAIVPLLTADDRAELDALTGGQGAAAIAATAAGSRRTWCGTIDDRPMFLAGLMADGDAWMLGTPEIARARKFYLRSTRRMVAEMQAMAPVLRVKVDIRYTRSVRWLRWLGFDLGEPVSYAGRMVHPAERRKPR